MVSLIGVNGIKKCLHELRLRDLGQILDQLSFLVEQNFKDSDETIRDGMDMALIAIKRKTGSTDLGEVFYSGANNPLWILNEKRTSWPESAKPFKTGYGADKKGGKKFKSANMKKLLIQLQPLTMQQQHDELLIAFDRWKGSLEQVDDVCVIGVRV